MNLKEQEAFRIVCADIAAMMSVSAVHVAEALTEVCEKLRAAGLIPVPQPADPMQAALAARRSRNTGPPVRHRTPRRIVPRGERSR